MTDATPTDGPVPLAHAPPELFYPGLSPQLLARVKLLWSASGLDFDRYWRLGLRSLPGFRPVPQVDFAHDSAQVDLVFLFDQTVIWVRALHEAASLGAAYGAPPVTDAQWHGLAGLTARLTEQLSALRLLALNALPMPAMQIARSVSEDADMALVLLVRPKLAQQFANCRSVDDANDFWRRHIAGGRAFRSISERLYSVGIDYSADTDYAKWRKQVLTTLGAAVHSNALQTRLPQRPRGQILLNDDSLHFATFRMHELCAFAQLIQPEFTEALTNLTGRAARAQGLAHMAGIAAPLNAVLINQMHSLTAPGTSQGLARH